MMFLLRGLAAFIATIPWPTLHRCQHKSEPTHLPVGMRTLRRTTAMTHRVSVTVELSNPDLIARAVELLTRTAVGISLERRGGRRMIHILLWILLAVLILAGIAFLVGRR